jgi:hypothetical protein
MLVSDDPTYAITDAMYWSAIETNIGITAASLPPCKIIITQYAPRLLGYRESSESYASGPTSRGRNRAYGRMTSDNRHKDFGDVALQGVSSGNGTGGGYAANVETDFVRKTMGPTTKILNRDSDEEELSPRTGQIGVHTQIETRFENTDGMSPSS